MILNSIEIENFGIYTTKQNISLNTNEDKNIILIGALNGSGKTTFLIALQIALYGKIAPVVREQTSAYLKYINNKINYLSNTAELSLNFNLYDNNYIISRSWIRKDDKIKESFKVTVNGQYKKYLSLEWLEHMETILPVRISTLFLFDGEKIGELADLSKTSDILTTAFNSLLGLDIVDNLELDLKKFITKKSSTQKGHNQQYIDTIAKLKTTLARKKSLKDELTLLEQDTQDEEDELKKAKDIFSRNGGDLFERQMIYKSELAKKEVFFNTESNHLSAISEANGPLLLVTDLLKKIHKQSKKEIEANNSKQIQESIREYHNSITELVPLDAKLDAKLSQFLKDKIALLESQSNVNHYINLSDHAYQQLSLFITDEMEDLSTKAYQHHSKLEEIHKEIYDINKLLSSAPPEEKVADLLANIKIIEHRILGFQEESALINKELEQLTKEENLFLTSIKAELKQKLDSNITSVNDKRLIQYSSVSIETLKKFKTSIIEYNIKRIENLIFDCFNKLTRKTVLIDRIDISFDENNYILSLYNKDNHRINSDDLSAGERQIFAISLLWALSLASKFEAPVIIDTPLGRLDSEHRDLLLKNYFPQASKQVILLSTDEEINGKHYKKLKKNISRSYTIQFNEHTNSSIFENEYLF